MPSARPSPAARTRPEARRGSHRAVSAPCATRDGPVPVRPRPTDVGRCATAAGVASPARASRRAERAISESRGAQARQGWEPEGLIGVWALFEDGTGRSRNRTGAARVGFALVLGLFEGRTGSRSRPEGPCRRGGVRGPAGRGARRRVGGPRRAEQGGPAARGGIRAAYGFRATTEEDRGQVAGGRAAPGGAARGPVRRRAGEARRRLTCARRRSTRRARRTRRTRSAGDRLGG